MEAPRHILLTSDLSHEAVRAFRPVCDIALATDAQITLTHVVPALHGESEAQLADSGESARLRLDEQSHMLDADVPIDTRVVFGASVPDRIVELALEVGADVIAMSTHGRSGVRRFVVGSVAEEVVRRSPLPVLCYPPAES